MTEGRDFYQAQMSYRRAHLLHIPMGSQETHTHMVWSIELRSCASWSTAQSRAMEIESGRARSHQPSFGLFSFSYGLKKKKKKVRFHMKCSKEKIGKI